MIFISYRRNESRGHARSMFERLQHKFPGQVFMDVNDMKPGENFRTKIEAQLQGCRVLLALIGSEWQGVTDKQGRVRLQDKRDSVRFEIVRALQRKITVIPVLIDGALMPDEDALPEDLHPMLDLQALPLDLDRHFDHGMADLVVALNWYLNQSQPFGAGGISQASDDRVVPIQHEVTELQLTAPDFSIDGSAQDTPVLRVPPASEVNALTQGKRVFRVPPASAVSALTQDKSILRVPPASTVNALAQDKPVLRAPPTSELNALTQGKRVLRVPPAILGNAQDQEKQVPVWPFPSPNALAPKMQSLAPDAPWPFPTGEKT